MVPDAGDAGDAGDAAEPGVAVGAGDADEVTGGGPAGGHPPDGDGLGTLGEELAAADDPVWLHALAQAIGDAGPDDPAGTVLPGAPAAPGAPPDLDAQPAGVDPRPPTPA